ncbi:MAG TPA: glycosyltransferase family 4 protein [Candidatus Aphodovivens avistercoris]|nr:glycosyltransferase family 4 protein [Candidatus Aphodovivens avistercoris]
MDQTDGPKRFVIFSRYLPSMGGIETFTDSLAKELSSRGHHVTIVTTDGYGHCDSLGRNEHLAVVRLNSRSMLGGRFPIPLPTPKSEKALKRVMASDPNYVMINARYYLLSQIGAVFSKKLGIRPILLDHSSSYIPSSNPLISKAITIAEHAASKRLTSITGIDFYGVSKKSSAWLSTFSIDSRGEIHNAIDAAEFRKARTETSFRARFAINENAMVVSLVSRLVEGKGAIELIKAAETLQHCDIHFLIAGDGPLAAKASEMTRDLARVHLLGRLQRGDVSALLQESDVFCFPTSYAEGMPTSLLEAGACGNALVVTDTGGTEEIVPDASHGIVLESVKPNDIAKALLRLYDNPDALSQLKAKAANHIESNFSWRKTADSVVRACQQANSASAHR